MFTRHLRTLCKMIIGLIFEGSPLKVVCLAEDTSFSEVLFE